jgi:hypothetical protein
MASRKSRVRAKRRDRRKAKQSGWRRAGKAMGGHVGHGSSAPHTVIFRTPKERKAMTRKCQ